MLPAIGFGIITGLSLGLTGSGGSILALPLMVYGLHIPVEQAVILSLAVVGMIAATGAVRQTGKGGVDWKLAGIFALTGMAASPLVLHYAAAMDQTLRLILFAVLMLVVAARMVVAGKPKTDRPAFSLSGSGDYFKALAGGVVAGSLAGLFGIGGGFIIVPLLVIALHIPYSRAVGTSLAIIFLISLSGTAYGVLGAQALPWIVLVPFAIGGIGGVLAGSMVAHRLPEKTMKRVFAMLIIIMAGWIMFDSFWLKPALAGL